MQLRAAEAIMAEEVEAMTGRRVLPKAKLVVEATRNQLLTVVAIKKELQTYGKRAHVG